MRATKVNIYISYTPEDAAYLSKLLRWLQPMRDEVNIWHLSAPPSRQELSLPWKILLFWYDPPDPRPYYFRTLRSQLEAAHICLFLTSYRSLTDSRVNDEITAAVTRHIEHGDRYVRIFPIITSPSHWKSRSRLAHFKPIGPKKALNQIQPEEEGYLELTDQLSKEIKALQRNLDELRFARSQPGEASDAWPALLGEPQVHRPPESVSPPELLGWAILLVLALSVWYSLSPSLPSLPSRRYQNVERETPPTEYRREYPLMPPPPGDSIIGR